MEMIIKASRQGCPDSGHLFEIGDPGAHHPLQAAEVLEQLATLGGTEAWNDLEHGFIVAAGALAAVAGDGEAVRLVPDALD